MGGVEQELLARIPAFSPAPPLLSKGAAWLGLERRNRETSLSKCSCAATWLHLLTAHTPITALSRFRGHPPPPMPGPGVSAYFPEGRAWAPRLSRRYGRPLRCAEPPAWGGVPSGLRLVETSTGRRPAGRFSLTWAPGRLPVVHCLPERKFADPHRHQLPPRPFAHPKQCSGGKHVSPRTEGREGELNIDDEIFRSSLQILL